MPDAQPLNEDFESDETLAANFSRLMAGRSVGGLRAEMAAKKITIGQGRIQAAKAGSRGLRLETLQKFADFFECSLADLLADPATNPQGWPFKRLTPALLARVSPNILEAAEGMLIADAERTVPRSAVNTADFAGKPPAPAPSHLADEKKPAYLGKK